MENKFQLVDDAYLEKMRRVDKRGGPPHDGGMDHERRISELEKIVPTLASKGDIATLPTKSDFAEFRADFAKLQASIADVRTDIQKSLTDGQRSITENTRWTHSALWAILGTFVIGLLGLLFTIYNAAKTPTASIAAERTQPPIIINVPGQSPPASTNQSK